MKAVANAMFELLRERLLLLDQLRHVGNGLLQDLRSGRRRNRLGEDVGEAGEEVDIVFVECIVDFAIDLKNAEWRSGLRRDQNVHRRNDTVILVEGWRGVGVGLSYIRT